MTDDMCGRAPGCIWTAGHEQLCEMSTAGLHPVDLRNLAFLMAEVRAQQDALTDDVEEQS